MCDEIIFASFELGAEGLVSGSVFVVGFVDADDVASYACGCNNDVFGVHVFAHEVAVRRSDGLIFSNFKLVRW